MEPEVSAVSGIAPFSSPLRVVHVVDSVQRRVVSNVQAVGRHQSAGGWQVRILAGTTPRGAGWRHRSARRLRREIMRSSPDVVVAHGFSAGVSTRLAIRGRICTVYVSYEEERTGSDPLTRAVRRQWERRAASWTNVAVVPTARAARCFVSSRIRAPLVTLPDDHARDDRGMLDLLAAVIARAHAFGHARPTRR